MSTDLRPTFEFASERYPTLPCQNINGGHPISPPRSRAKTGADVLPPGAGLTEQSVALVYRALLDSALAAGLFSEANVAELDAWRNGLTAASA